MFKLNRGQYLYQCLGNFWRSSHFGHPRWGEACVKGGSGERKPSRTCWVGQEPATRLPGLPCPPFPGGPRSGWRRRGSLYCVLFSGTSVDACCHHSLCELSVGVRHENFPSLCRVIYVCLVQFLPTYYRIHHERPFLFLNFFYRDNSYCLQKIIQTSFKGSLYCWLVQCLIQCMTHNA